MKVFLNGGHAPNGDPDPGAVNPFNGVRESDVAQNVADLVEKYLVSAGVEVCGNLQSDDLDEVCSASNCADADLFISIHCNASTNAEANGTEVWYHSASISGRALAECIQTQIVDGLETTDRGIKKAVPGENGLYVLNNTDAVAVLVELAFITNSDDCILLTENADDFARAIARGVTDYQGTEADEQTSEQASEQDGEYVSKYFKREETECHCGCGGNVVNPLLLKKLDALRELVGGPLYISCAYRCPKHNAEVGGVSNSQHTLGNAADVQTPEYDWCNTPDKLAWYCEQIGVDGIGIYDWGCHIDVRDDGKSPNEYRWDDR